MAGHRLARIAEWHAPAGGQDRRLAWVGDEQVVGEVVDQLAVWSLPIGGPYQRELLRIAPVRLSAKRGHRRTESLVPRLVLPDGEDVGRRHTQAARPRWLHLRR